MAALELPSGERPMLSPEADHGGQTQTEHPGKPLEFRLTRTHDPGISIPNIRSEPSDAVDAAESACGIERHRSDPCGRAIADNLALNRLYRSANSRKRVRQFL